MTGLPHRWAMLIPGPIERTSGGTIYDRRIVEGAHHAGDDVVVMSLDGNFPGELSEVHRGAAINCLASLDEHAPPRTLVVDGLVLPSLHRELCDYAESRPMVVLVHHPVSEEPGLVEPERMRIRELELRVIRVARRIICTSAYTRRVLVAEGIGESRISVVNPGVDLLEKAGSGELPAAADALPAATSSGRGTVPVGDSGTKLNMLCVSNLMRRKGLSVLIDALAMLNDARPSTSDRTVALHWQLTIVGSTEMEPETALALGARVKTAGLSDRVQFVGSLNEAELSKQYRAADLFIFPSLYEGYGMVLTEAAAHGLPILTTDGGAIPDTVAKLAAEVVPAGNADALAEAIERFLTDPTYRDRMQRMAARAVATLTPWPTAVARFREIVADEF